MNVTRIGIAVALIVSGISHAYLYIHGYQHIPTIGSAFVVQASVSFALALLIMIGGPGWLGGPGQRWPAGLWSPSSCRGPSGSWDSSNKDGSRHRTRRSAWSPSC